jgi:hypothetical protein
MEAATQLLCTMKDCAEPRADQDPDATNRHCRKHRNEATKRYLMSKAEQEEAKAFHKGVEAMRDHIAANFENYGNYQRWSGAEFAAIVRKVDGPKFRDASLPAAVAS